MGAHAPTGRQREAASTRDVILDAAERRFAERGFAGVSVREIAADAGLKNQASLYHHFKNKKALYEAVIARGIQPILELVAASDTNSTDPVLDEVVDYLAARPHLPRLIQRAGLDDSKFLRDSVTRFIEPLYYEGLDVLANNRGQWEQSEIPHLAAGLYHLIFGYFASASLFEPLFPEKPSSAAAVARQRRFLKTAVARLLGTEATTRAARSAAK